ncbi:MAG: hypothetical protein Q9221_007720 [Calogaya cf. arnoldii]
MAKLTSHKVLAFDVYGTLIDWETGITTALTQGYIDLNLSKTEILHAFHNLEKEYQSRYPDLAYSELLAKLHPALTSDLNLTAPTESVSQQFGDSVGSWPAFPDTLAALKRLKTHFKLVVLSNTDRDSFAATNKNQLPGVEFDAVLTAQDIGSYKPDRRNFEYLLDYTHRTWGISKDEVLQTAQSQFHDHYPAKDVGIRSAWIVRPGAVMGEQGQKGEEIWNWKFHILGEMADAVDKETS